MVRLMRARPRSVSRAESTTEVSDSLRMPTAAALLVGTRSVIFSLSKLMTKSSSLCPATSCSSISRIWPTPWAGYTTYSFVLKVILGAAGLAGSFAFGVSAFAGFAGAASFAVSLAASAAALALFAFSAARLFAAAIRLLAALLGRVPVAFAAASLAGAFASAGFFAAACFAAAFAAGLGALFGFTEALALAVDFAAVFAGAFAAAFGAAALALVAAGLAAALGAALAVLVLAV